MPAKQYIPPALTLAAVGDRESCFSHTADGKIGVTYRAAAVDSNGRRLDIPPAFFIVGDVVSAWNANVSASIKSGSLSVAAYLLAGNLSDALPFPALAGTQAAFPLVSDLTPSTQAFILAFIAFGDSKLGFK